MRLIYPKDTNGVLKSVFVMYFILVLHILLIVGLGFLVLFFRGIIFYMPWILFFGSAAIITSGYLLYRRAKKEGKTLQQILSLPVFKNRSVEVSFLGGLASLKIGKPYRLPEIENAFPGDIRRLEDPDSLNIDELAALARLLERKLISQDEYNIVKQKFFKNILP